MPRKHKTPRSPEAAQLAADAYIELAQWFEREAQRLKAIARGYRTGELLPMYTGLPANAHASMRAPAARAIDGLSSYDCRRAVERIRQNLIAETQPERTHEPGCHNLSTESDRYGEPCGCGVEW